MTSPQEEIGKATDDARLLGTGFLMVTADGAKRVEPRNTVKIRLPDSWRPTTRNECPPLTSGDIEAYQNRSTPTELRPLPEHADKPHHFAEHPLLISRKMMTEVLAWCEGRWLIAGDESPHSPADLADAGWRYLGPAEWNAGSWDREQALRSASDEMLQAAADRIAQLEVAIRLRDAGLEYRVDRIVALEAENARLDRKLPTLQQANRLLDPSATERVAKFWMDRERSYYGTQFERFAHARLSEVIRTSRWMGLLSVAERLSAAWEHLPCITEGAIAPRPADGFPARALRGGDGVPR